MWRIAFLAALAFPKYASAEMFCYEYKDLKKSMSERGAERFFSGVTRSKTNIIEVWVFKNGIWTVFVIGLDGTACTLDSGEHYRGPASHA